MEEEKESKIAKNYNKHAGKVNKLSDRAGQILAVCAGYGRYHGFDGEGALKYDPLDVVSIPAEAGQLLQQIRLRRWHTTDKITLKTLIYAGCYNTHRKIMIVPSIGCPSELTIYNKIQQLLWAQCAEDRPTFLLVHNCEAQAYIHTIGGVLADIGVGLVSWRCGGRVGFGLSRLAAQQYAAHLSQERLRVVLCDVNVSGGTFGRTAKSVGPRGQKIGINHLLNSGYDTDEQDESDVEGETGFELHEGRKRKLLYAAGTGAGIPSFEYDDSNDNYNTRKRQKKKALFTKTRPIEQLVVVRPELQYDPCFITSSEDADLQNAFLAQLNPVESVDKFKYEDAFIEKVVFNGSNSLSYIYVDKRDAYLKRLAYEDDFLIQYNFKGKEKIIKVGDLARVIAKQHGKKQWDIRSLIIEKILLKHRRGVN